MTVEEVGGRNESPAGAAVSLHPEVRGVRAVLFDVGGTLLHPDWERLARLAEAEAGRALGSVELQRAFKDLIRRVDVAMCDGSPLPYDTGRRGWVFQSMYGALGLDDESCARLSLTVDAAHAERHLWCGLDGDAPRVLDALRAAGFAVAAISNTEDGRLEELLEMAGLGQKFDFALDSFHVGCRKPDAEIFQMALARLNLAPAEAVYVGDSYGHDALAARAAGLRAILLDPLNLYPDAVCARIGGLRDLIEHGRL